MIFMKKKQLGFGNSNLGYFLILKTNDQFLEAHIDDQDLEVHSLVTIQ